MPRDPNTRDPWAFFSARCAVLYLAACNKCDTREQWEAARAARDALPAHGVDEGMTLALSERHLRDAFQVAEVFALKTVEARMVLWAGVRLFAVARAARKEHADDPKRGKPEYWWQEHGE